MISLTDINRHPRGAYVAWDLLCERTGRINISHDPARADFAQHIMFVRYHPYRFWGIIENDERQPVGSLYLTPHNEIGVFIMQAFQRRGYASAAIKVAIGTYQPLEAIPGARSDKWLANISPYNITSMRLFMALGFELKQVTYQLGESNGARNGHEGGDRREQAGGEAGRADQAQAAG